MERDEPFSTYNTKNGTERNVDWNDWKKNERGRNDLAEGPRSRTERDDLKKVVTCPTLTMSLKYIFLSNAHFLRIMSCLVKDVL